MIFWWILSKLFPERLPKGLTPDELASTLGNQTESLDHEGQVLRVEHETGITRTHRGRGALNL